MLQPGDTIDIWVVESALGSGGMGSVYRCHNRAATRILAAIKVLDGGLTRYPEAEARFIREAEILFQLDHPNIVKVRNVRIDADPPYLEMEFVAGESLDDRLRRGPVPFGEAVALMRQTADALAYLHSKGIYHRDIKPANLLVQPEAHIPIAQSGLGPRGLASDTLGPRNLKLVDFGLAVEADGSRITQAGMAFGTVSYAPPEWITPEALDPIKWDMYAFGVVFHEILTGTLAFPISGQGTARQQAMQVIIAKQGHPPLDPGEAFHDDVRQLIRELTDPDPAARLCDANTVFKRISRLEPTLKKAAGVTLTPSMVDDPFLPSLPPETESMDPVGLPPRVAQLVRTPAPPTVAVGHRSGVSRLAFAALGVGVVLLALTSVASLAAVAAWWRLLPTERPVSLHLRGVDAEKAIPVEVRIGTLPPMISPMTEGQQPTIRFAAVPLGATIVRWVAGESCVPSASTDISDIALNPWCTSGQIVAEIEPGRREMVIDLDIEPPVDRAAAFLLPELDPAIPLSAALSPKGRKQGPTIEGQKAPGGLSFPAVMPGPYTLTLSVGDCAGQGSSPRCKHHQIDVVVPVRGSPSPASLPFTSPEGLAPAAADPGKAPPSPAPPAPPRPAPSKRSPLVSKAQLAAFVEAHPEWKPGGSFAARIEPEKYLSWLSTDVDDEPAFQMTPALAEAYCEAKGMRLPEVNEAPMVDLDKYELRQEDGKPKVVEVSEKETRLNPTGRMETLIRVVGFRCVK